MNIIQQFLNRPSKFGCSKSYSHKWKDGYWTIGDCGRYQAEGCCGFRCYNCGEIRYYNTKWVDSKLVIEYTTIEQERIKAIKYITGLDIPVDKVVNWNYVRSSIENKYKEDRYLSGGYC